MNKIIHIVIIFIFLNLSNIHHAYGYNFAEKEDYKFYQLNLKYPLTNDETKKIKTQIALPPDTIKQRVHINSVAPGPERIFIDESGNLMAEFELNPLSQKTIILDAVVKTMINNDHYPESNPTLFLETQNTPYWQLDHNNHQNLDIKSINQFVTQTLTYDEKVITRKTAKETLKSPTGVCQEFTDLFVGLARINQIPAKRHVGYGFTQEDNLRPLGIGPDILHTWPSYFNYTTMNWKFADPTWENTTNGKDYFQDFDLDHITFAIQGLEDDYPHPAGMYGPNTAESNVLVSTTNSFNEELFDATIAIKKNKVAYFLNKKYIINIQNNTGFNWYNIKLENAGIGELIFKQDKFDLLAHQTIEIPFQAFSNSNSKKTDHLQIFLEIDKNNNLYTLSTINYERKIWKKISPTIILLALASISVTFFSRSLLVYRSKKDDSIRW